MSVDKAEVLRIARLARLELEGPAAEAMARDLNQILAHVEKLQQVNTDNVPPYAYLSGRSTPLAEDRVARFDHVEEALDNAPRREGRFYIVPRVIE